MNKLKQNKGITLIALIITIVVLLILAGVSINMVIGENGLIKKAQSGVDTYQNSATEEQVFLNEIENYIAGGLANIDSIGGSVKKDTLPPKQFTPTVTATETSITITGSTEDEEETEASACSGIKEYWFSKDNGATWQTNEDRLEISYTYTDLSVTEEFSFKMKAIDNVGNETMTLAITSQTVTYFARNGTSTSKSMVVYGDKYTAEANSFSAPKGYGFSGWSTDVSSKAATVLPNSEVDVSNLNLYAVWTCNTGYNTCRQAYIDLGTTSSGWRVRCARCGAEGEVRTGMLGHADMNQHWASSSCKCSHGILHDEHRWCDHRSRVDHVY